MKDDVIKLSTIPHEESGVQLIWYFVLPWVVKYASKWPIKMAKVIRIIEIYRRGLT